MLRKLMILTLVLWLTACTGGNEQAATPTPIDPQTLLQQVIRNLQAVKTFRLLIEQVGAPYVFSVTLDGGATQVVASMPRADGQFENPNILYANVRLIVSGVPLNAEIFARGLDQWVKAVLPSWINFPIAEGFDPGRLMQDDTGFSAAITQLDSMEYIGEENLLDGTPVYHTRGIAKGQVINDLMFGLLSLEQDNIIVDVYVNRDVLLPSLLVVTLPDSATEAEPDNTQWRIEIYDVNAAISFAYPDQTPEP